MKRLHHFFIYKIFLGILMPVFLLAPALGLSQAQTEGTMRITIKIKSEKDPVSFFTRHNIVPTHSFAALDNPLFANIFNARIPADQLNAIQQDPDVSYAQTDPEVSAVTVTTNDPFFTTDPIDQDKQWYLAKTKVPDAWDTTKGSSSVVVAIIDTGIHATHIELNDGRVIAGFNILTNQPIPANSNSDDNGHGTSVAGVIGAVPNNSKGLAGINWNIQLMPVKALAADGTGDLSAVSGGIIWAADHGANIINLSLGGNGFGPDVTLSNAITYAFNRGVLIVAASGNDLADGGMNLDTSLVFPICADNGKNMVLGVAVTDVNDQKVDFSNFGHNCIDVSAPGKHILTAAFLPNNPSDNVLIYGSGTSLGAPIVSGIAALVKSTNPNLSNVEIQKIIMRTADPIDALNQTSCLGGSCNGFLGGGRINAAAAVKPQPVQPLADGTLVREASTGSIYMIMNNTKRPVSSFVMTQRNLDPNSAVSEVNNQLTFIQTGSPLPPLEGTLLKSPDDPQVYVINQELKRPVTFLVFVSRGYNFADLKIISQAELTSYATGDWYWPPDSTMVLITGNPLVYVMDQQVARPTTFFVFMQRKLSFSKVIKVTADEFSHVPRPADQYWLPPLEGSLIKSAIDPGIYVIENGTRKLLSEAAFLARGYQFGNVKTLPQVEIDVIAPGAIIL
ncbi:MAG: S8 family serine peptidase [Candidatus Doudnabacteria bacterium]